MAFAVTHEKTLVRVEPLPDPSRCHSLHTWSNRSPARHAVYDAHKHTIFANNYLAANCLPCQVEIKLRLPDEAAYTKVQELIAPGLKATYLQVSSIHFLFLVRQP
jgi:hypothetical protein